MVSDALHHVQELLKRSLNAIIFVVKEKNIEATETGIALIDTIHEKLLTSAELTGIWEKKLRDIEAKKYDASQFINELKEQLTNIVNDVLADNSTRKIGEIEDNKGK